MMGSKKAWREREGGHKWVKAGTRHQTLPPCDNIFSPPPLPSHYLPSTCTPTTSPTSPPHHPPPHHTNIPASHSHSQHTIYAYIYPRHAILCHTIHSPPPHQYPSSTSTPPTHHNITTTPAIVYIYPRHTISFVSYHPCTPPTASTLLPHHFRKLIYSRITPPALPHYHYITSSLPRPPTIPPIHNMHHHLPHSTTPQLTYTFHSLPLYPLPHHNHLIVQPCLLQDHYSYHNFLHLNMLDATPLHLLYVTW